MNALVCACSGIGNSLCTIPLIRALKSIGYDIDVRISKSRGAESLFVSMPEVSGVVDVAEKLTQYDVACCTHLCQSYHSGCKLGKRILMIEPGLVPDFTAESIKRYTKHEIEHCVDLARQLGYAGPTPVFQLPTDSQNVSRFGIHTLVNPVAIGVGYLKLDSFSHKKHWGNSNFSKLMSLMIQAGFSPVVLGAPEDDKNVGEMLSLIKVNERQKVTVLTNQSLMDSLAVFRLCRACVTNETMWVVASAVGIPTISMIFLDALNNPTKTYPYPSGIALYGSKEEMTVGRVWENFQRMWNGGAPYRWGKVQNVNSATYCETIKSSKLNALRAGFGQKGPKVSIVQLLCDLPSPDSFDSNVQCSGEVLKTAPKDSEIILVANAPSDKLLKFLSDTEKSDSRVVSIVSGRNLGVVAKNLGYNVAQGEYIISLDGDVLPKAGWVEKMVSFMDAHKDVGLCGPCGGQVRVDQWTPQVWPVSSFPSGPRSFFGYEDITFFGTQTESGRDGTPLDVIPSMVWCFRRSLLLKVGYLDWRFGPFVGSDADFCFRIKRLGGMKVVICRVPISHIKSGGCSHTMFRDLLDLKVDHVAELHRRWYPHASVVCETFKLTGGYVPPK